MSKTLLVIPVLLVLLVVPTTVFAQTDFGSSSSLTTDEFEPFPTETEFTVATDTTSSVVQDGIPDFDFDNVNIGDIDYVQYWHMTQTDDSIQVNTFDGKVTFDKSNGAMTIFANLENTESDGTAEFVKVDSDSFVVRGAPINTDNWFNLSVNDSPVTYTIDEREQKVVITFTKTNAEGTFDLVTEVYNNHFKSTAYFTNTSFVDHKFAFTETVSLPDSIIKLNSQDIDLSQFVGQSFPREVLEENIDLILEVEGLGYHSGVGFDNLWQVNIHENNTVSLDYANVGNVITPIGETVELDPFWDWEQSGTGNPLGTVFSQLQAVDHYDNGDFLACSSDANNQGCYKYDKGGNYLSTFTTATNPTQVAIDEDNGEVWTVSYVQGVKKFDLNGTMLLSSFGSASQHTGIFVDSDDNLWISSANTGLQKYDSNRNLSFTMTNFGGDVCTQCQSFVTEDLDGNIWVSMSYKHKLYKIDKSGNHILTTGQNTNTIGNASLFYPHHVDVDKNTGNIWVSGEFNYGVMEYDTHGNFLQHFGGQTTGFHSSYPAGVGLEDGKFKDPMGMSVHDGKIIVGDYLKNTFQRFDIDYPEPNPTPSYISTPASYAERFAIYDSSYGAGTNTSCSGSTTWAKQTGNQPLYQVVPASTTNNNSCYMGGTQFDLSNIPSDVVVTSVVMKFNVNSSTNPPACDFVHMGLNNGDVRDSSVTSTDMYNEIITNGTVLARNSSSCSGEVGDVGTVNLGVNGVVELQNALDNNHSYFAVGQKPSNTYRTAYNVDASYINQTLLVTYAVPPTATTLTASYANGNADLSWTAVTDGSSTKIISPVAKQYTAGTTNLSDGLGEYGIRSPANWLPIYDHSNVSRDPTSPTTSQNDAILGSSMFFNGITDVIGNDHISGGSPNLTDKASISVWIKPMGNPLNHGGASSGNPLAVLSNGGAIYFLQNGQWSSVYPLNSFNVGSVYSNANAFNMYEWNHLVISGDSSSSANLSSCAFSSCVMELDVYMNGQKIQMYSYPSGTGGGTASNATDKSIVGTFSNWALGAQYHSSPLFKYPFHGYIDEFANWNTTLTQADVTALYNDGKGNLPSVANKNSNLVNYLPLDDSSFPIQNHAIRDTDDLHSNYIVTSTAYDPLTGSGTAKGNPIKNVDGIYGSAWEFNGRYYGDYVDSVMVQFPNERSVSQWFNADLKDYGYLVGGNSMGELSTQANGGGYSWAGAIPAGTFSDNTWHHVVQTKDVNNNTKLYVDGTQILTGSLTWATMNSPTQFCIGISGCGVITNGSTHSTLNGKIDEVAMYERELTASEVTALYNSGNSALPNAISTTGLTHYFNFEQTGNQLTNMAVVKDPTFLTYDVVKNGNIIATTGNLSYSDPITTQSTYEIQASVGQQAITKSLSSPDYYAPASHTNANASPAQSECDSTHPTWSSWVWYSSNYVPWFGTHNGCRVSGYSFDITSIPDSANIVDVDIEYDIGFSADSPMMKWTSQEQGFSGTNAYVTSTDAWNDAHNNNSVNRIGVTYAENQVALTTGMKDQSLDLGEVAVQHVTNQLTSSTSVNGVGDWFGLYSPFVTDGDFSGVLKRTSTSNVELQVTYALGNFATSNTQTVSPPPPAPTGLTATVNAPNVDLSWTASTGATSYKIETSTDDITYTTLVADTGNANVTYSHTAPIQNTTHYYQVSAISSAGTGSASSSASATVGGVPDVPTGLTATFNSTTTDMDLAFTAPSQTNGSAIVGYKVEVSTDNATWTTVVADTGNTNTTYTDLNPTMGSLNYYKVSAINAYGTGAVSNIDNDIAGLPPDAPTITSTSTANPNTAPLEITVNWQAPTNTGTAGITNYEVYRDGTLVTTVGNVTTYVDTVTTGGGTFVYSLKSVTPHGTSVLSATASHTTPTVPPAPTSAPTLAIANPDSNPFDVTLSWALPSSGGSAITSFEVFRSTDDITYTSVGNTSQLIFYDTVPNVGTFYYKFSSINLVGNSAQSPSSNIATPTEPVADSSVTLAINSPDPSPLDITISIVAPSGNGGSAITGYNLHSSSDDITYTQIATNVTTDQTVTVSSAGTWYFKSQAINNAGTAGLGSATSIATPSVPTGDASVTLNIPDPNNFPFDSTATFVAPSGNGGSAITGYNLYYSDDDITYSQIATASNSVISQTLTGAGTHYFKVESINNIGTSALSSAITIGTPTVPLADASATLAINNPNPSPLTITATLVAPSSDGGSAVTNYNLWISNDDITYTQIATAINGTFDQTVSQSGTYYFKVEATNLVGTGGLGSATSIATPTVPTAPQNAGSTIADIDNAPYDVTVTWETPSSTGGSDLTQYNVYRKQGSSAYSLLTTTTGLSITDTVPTSLTTNFTYKIHSVNNVGESTAFDDTTITTFNVPSAPTLSVTTGTTVLSWNTPASDATVSSYKIYRDNVLITTVGAVTTYSDFSTIVFGNSYDFKIVAVSSLGDSADSNTVTTTPETEITGMVARGVTGTGAVIDWDEPAYYQGQVTSYNVYYGNSGTPATSAGTTTNTFSNFAPQLDYDTTYVFGVSINSPLGNSGLSNIVAITTNIDTSIVSADPTTGGAGWFDIDSVNNQSVNVIEFQRETQMISGNLTDTLQVAYPTWWDDMTCDVDYKFAQKTEQYVEGDDMTAQVNSANADQQVIGFQFQEVDNEVIEVQCAPQQSTQDDGVSAKYVMTQNNLGAVGEVGTPNIPIVAQITNFSNGTYGTDGDFGALNIVGLFAILVSMVGFNRLNPIVGVLLSASMIFVLSWFGIITIPTAIIGAIALVIFLAWGATRNR